MLILLHLPTAPGPICVNCAWPEPWRKALSKGDCIDGADSLHKWYTAKILETREGRTPGACKQVLVSYDGWSAYYNEWLNINTFMYVCRVPWGCLASALGLEAGWLFVGKMCVFLRMCVGGWG